MFTHEITSLVRRPLPRFVVHSTDLHRGVTWHLTMKVASMLLGLLFTQAPLIPGIHDQFYWNLACDEYLNLLAD